MEENQDYNDLESLLSCSKDNFGKSFSMDDFEDTVVRMQPSTMGEGFITRPKVSWDKVHFPCGFSRNGKRGHDHGHR